jgi:hypothetical protein
MGNQLATTESQDDLDKVIHAGQSAAVPGFIMARVPKVWSPNVPAMGMSWAMTAKEKSDATDKAADNARQAARDAQTAANENANLKLRGQEVGIQAGNLAERRKEGVAAQLTPQNVNDSARTTLSGTKYLDMGDFETPKEKSAARAAAQAAKLPVVDAKTGASLRAIDSAKQNAMEMWRQIGQYLPKDASGRILGGPENTLAKVFQTHPELGAYGAWRTAAIQQVQALAEPGMGLRINQAEINAAMENDIPQITDDAATGAQRLKNLFTMLNNKERDALTRDRSTLNAPTSTPATGNPFRK